MSKPKVLFVCLGNICRSPTAEAVFRHKAAAANLDVFIDSAGTGAWHAGELPDARARETGGARGYSFAGQTARAVNDDDFLEFDLILAMDRRNYSALIAKAPGTQIERVRLFLDFGTSGETEVPDPYYGGPDGFELVLDLIENASNGLIAHLQQ